MSGDDHKIKAFASDDNLKALGELLSNETSRKIISHLMKQEMYTNEISTKLDIRISLVIHHLKKMEDLGLLEITNKKIIKKGEKHRFFKIDCDIFITLNNTKEEIKEKGILKRIFRDGLKFTSLGIIGLSSWVGTQIIQHKPYPPDIFYEEAVIKIPITMLWSILFTGIFVGISILLLRFKKKEKSR